MYIDGCEIQTRRTFARGVVFRRAVNTVTVADVGRGTLSATVRLSNASSKYQPEQVSRGAHGVLGETFVPTRDANGEPIMTGMEAIRGSQEDCELLLKGWKSRATVGSDTHTRGALSVHVYKIRHKSVPLGGVCTQQRFRLCDFWSSILYGFRRENHC